VPAKAAPPGRRRLRGPGHRAAVYPTPRAGPPSRATRSGTPPRVLVHEASQNHDTAAPTGDPRGKCEISEKTTAARVAALRSSHDTLAPAGPRPTTRTCDPRPPAQARFLGLRILVRGAGALTDCWTPGRKEVPVGSRSRRNSSLGKQQNGPPARTPGPRCTGLIRDRERRRIPGGRKPSFPDRVGPTRWRAGLHAGTGGYNGS